MSGRPERSVSSRLESLEGPRRPDHDIAERIWARVEAHRESADDEAIRLDDLGTRRVRAALHGHDGSDSRRRIPMLLAAATLVVLAGVVGIVVAERSEDRSVDRVATEPLGAANPTATTEPDRICGLHGLPTLVAQISAASTGPPGADFAARLDAVRVATDEMAVVVANSPDDEVADGAETWRLAGRLVGLATTQLDAGDVEAAALSAEAFVQTAGLGLRRLDAAGADECGPTGEEP